MDRAAFALLRLLAPGRAVPPGATGLGGRALRAACAALAAHGLEVREEAGAIALAAPFDLLDAAAIGAALGPAAARVRLELIDACDSTSSLVAARAAAGAPSGTAIACELQTAGRGRRGASWHAALGTGLTFSLLWRAPEGAPRLDCLPLAAGVACARALESLGARGVALKWPNDLLLGKAKLGGILVEAQTAGAGPREAVIGIGVNVRLPAARRSAFPHPVADLHEAGFRGSRNVALGALLAALDEALARFARDGLAAFQAEWSRRDAWRGREVRVLVSPDRAIAGVARGIADDGALVLDTPDGVRRFHAGEVSLRESP